MKVQRFLQPTVVSLMANTPVVIVEAARAVGKTWLRSLPSPFAIDEAQLLPGLPLALKALLDETEESIQCVLTGSAAIGQTGVGGTDPWPVAFPG